MSRKKSSPLRRRHRCFCLHPALSQSWEGFWCCRLGLAAYSRKTPTTDSPPLPTPPPVPTTPLCCSVAFVLVAFAPAAPPEPVRSTDESRTSGCTSWSNRIRSVWLVGSGGRPCDSVLRPPESTPISSCVPTQFSWHVLTESGYILSVSTASPRVTFCMARYVSLTLS